MSETLRYARPEEVALESIPVIDFAPFLSGDPAGKARVAAEIDRACRQIGFFYLVNHGVPESLRQAVLDQSRQFFYRPVAEKMASAPLLDEQWCGYLPSRGSGEGTQPGGSLTEEGRKAKSVSGGTLEQFTMMRVCLADDAHYGDPDPVYQRNRWPAGAPEFVETMIVNQQALLRLGRHLMRAFALALDLDEDHFIGLHRSPLAAFGLNFYPKADELPPDGKVGVGAHCDASTFTVLLQDDTGGLEVKLRDGRWISAPVVPGAYVVNIGDTLMGWTNGTFVSNLHRVVTRQPADRFSATMFMNPDRDVVVAPIGTFVSDDNPARFAPFSNYDYMCQYYRKFYDTMFK